MTMPQLVELQSAMDFQKALEYLLEKKKELYNQWC
jgi:hypothetical protein